MTNDQTSENDGLGNQANKLKSKAADVAHAAADRARSEAETRKGAAAGTIDQLADAVDNVGGNLSDSPTLSRYASELSGSMHSLAERLRSRSIDDVANDVRSLARRNPTVFIAGSIAIGLLGARFLKATARRENASRDMGGMGTGMAVEEPAGGYVPESELSTQGFSEGLQS
jgi:hypothetical protein